jgi:hypothetical protein
MRRPQKRDPASENWIREQAHAVQLDENRCMAAERDAHAITIRSCPRLLPVPFMVTRSPFLRRDPRRLTKEEAMPPATATTTSSRGLSDEQITELLGLLKGSDSVELKLTVPERSTIVALGLDPLEAQIRQIFFFDTPGLALDKGGVVVRARRIQGKGGDAVVKLRPVVPDELPEDLRRSRSFRVEVDALPGGFVCSATMKGSVSQSDVRKAAAGDLRIRKLFSKEQRAFFAANAPEGVDLDGLSVLGPIFVLKLRVVPEELGRRFVAEMWIYPDGSRILELSTRAAPTEAFQVAAEARAFLAGRGIDLSGDQQTKTRKALQFFAKRATNGEV